jgi:hypothetical protein
MIEKLKLVQLQYKLVFAQCSFLNSRLYLYFAFVINLLFIFVLNKPILRYFRRV